MTKHARRIEITFSFFLLISTGKAVDVQAVNDNVMLKEDESTVIDVLRNDKIDNRENLDLTIISEPSLGSASLQGFSISYRPNSNVSGTDEFQYSIDDGFSSDTAKIKITLVAMNDVPISVELKNNSIPENGNDVVLIGALSTKDPDLDDSFRYSFSDERENDNAFFEIKDGSVYSNISFDYELRDNYKLLITSKDKSDKEVTSQIVVNITDVNEAPRFIENSEMKISHAEGNEKIVARLVTEDPDFDQDYVKYKVVGGDDKSRFKILRSGDLAFLSKPDFESPKDANSDNVYQVKFRVIDSKDKNLFVEGSASVTIIDQVEKSIESLDSRKYISWTVDHMPYHILMEDAIDDYINLRFSAGEDDDGTSLIEDSGDEQISQMSPSDQIIIVQEKANSQEIYEIWYGNGINYTIINRERVDWVLSQDIQQVLIEKSQYLNSESEVVFFKNESERLLAGYSSKFAVWHPNNFTMSLQGFSMRSNLIQYAANMSVGNPLIGLPSVLSGSTELGIATRNSEFGFRLPVGFSLGSIGKMDDPKYLSSDYPGLYSKINIENMYSTRTDFHALMGFSFYPKAIGSPIENTNFFNTESIDDKDRYINILDMYALMAATVEVPLQLPFFAKMTATPGLHYLKVAHRIKGEEGLYDRTFYQSGSKIIDIKESRSFSRYWGLYARFDILGKIGQKPEFLERIKYFDFISINDVPFYELSFQLISSLNTITTLNLNIYDNLALTITRYNTTGDIQGYWLPDKNTWFGLKYRGNF
tara:strand:+ start:5418 stop:7703 length:2286 start_codon:yes stop_codon:yes gene_type:complete